ncbi:hypothetical protein OSTOST_06908 [Ostertagia ostertagi]
MPRIRRRALGCLMNRVGNVEARIPTMTTSEIILTVDEDLETELSIEDTKCRVDNAMASREGDGDIKLVIDLATTRVLDQQQIQMELEMAAISLQRQKKIATGEQFSFTTHCLREAEVTKEKILRMGTRYLIMDFLYEYITEWGEASSFGRQDFIARKHYAFGPEAIRDLITPA